MSERVSLIHHGSIHELQLSRPPVNALDPALCQAIRTQVDASIDAGATGLVLSGSPGIFSAGLDVPHLMSLSDQAGVRAAWEAFADAARAIAASPVPVVAAITGHSPAGGCVLALCADYRVMAEGEYLIGLNETQVGLVAPAGIQHLMRRIVGPYRAERLLVSGQMVDARTAAALGLVDELVPADEVTPRAVQWLQALLALPREPMLETRAIARADLVAAMDPASLQIEGFLASWERPDTQAALRALVARLGK